MLKYVVKRLLILLPIVLVMSIMVFGLSTLSSGDAARVLAEQIYGHPTQTEIEQVRHENGLDQPICRQYVRWLGNVLHGDFGTSYQTQKSAVEELAKRFPATLKLAVTAFLLLLLAAIPLGIISAVWEHSWIDKLLQVFFLFQCLHAVFLAGADAALPFWSKIKADSNHRRDGCSYFGSGHAGYRLLWCGNSSDENKFE